MSEEQIIASLAYYSTRTTDMSRGEMVALASQAAIRNRSLGVSGFLTHRRGVFVQYLEGAQYDITALMDRINLDVRHQVEHVIVLQDAQRRFPDWAMRDLSEQAAVDVTLDDLLEEVLTSVKASHLAMGTDGSALVSGVVDKMSRRSWGQSPL